MFSFFVKPEQIEFLNKTYKEGLVLAMNVHQYNCLAWLDSISRKHCAGNNEEFNTFIDSVSKQLQELELQREDSSLMINNLINRASIQNLISLIDPLITNQNNPNIETKIKSLIICLNESKLKDLSKISERVLSDNCYSLFPDNE